MEEREIAKAEKKEERSTNKQRGGKYHKQIY